MVRITPWWGFDILAGWIEKIERDFKSIFSSFPIPFNEQKFYKAPFDIEEKFLKFLNKNINDYNKELINYLLDYNHISKILKWYPSDIIFPIINFFITVFIWYAFKNKISNNWKFTPYLIWINEKMELSGLTEIFPNLSEKKLSDLNDHAISEIISNKTRLVPLSYTIELPLFGKSFYILFEEEFFSKKYGELDEKLYESLKYIIDESTLDDLLKLKDLKISIFFWEEYPTDLKIEAMKSLKGSINKGIFPDQIWTFLLNWEEYYLNPCLRFAFGINFEKLRALIILW
jgi:hypothetical protein